jgi:hypothetical protein
MDLILKNERLKVTISIKIRKSISKNDFQEQILHKAFHRFYQIKEYEPEIKPCTKRKEILSSEKLAPKNALRYFEAKHHANYYPDLKKIKTYGRILHVPFSSSYKIRTSRQFPIIQNRTSKSNYVN